MSISILAGSLPQQFVERLSSFVPQDTLDSVLESFNSRKPSTFRANTLKISASVLQKELAKLQIEIERVPWYEDAFILKNVPQKVLTETPWYKEGFLYLQSLSSMIPPLVLDPHPNEKILDMTAAPGSKTTQIAALMQNSGEIVANDKSRVRLFKLEANIKGQGVTNVRIMHTLGQMIWKKYPEYFDRVLIDSPCSLEGMFLCNNPKTYQDWSLQKVKFLVQIQKFLLRSAISCTKVGGTIIYSTCTMSPEENEGIIDWILEKEKDAIQLEPIQLPVSESTEGLTYWNNKTFSQEIKKTMRIFPTIKMEAFFVAKIRKVKSTLSFQSLRQLSKER